MAKTFLKNVHMGIKLWIKLGERKAIVSLELWVQQIFCLIEAILCLSVGVGGWGAAFVIPTQ